MNLEIVTAERRVFSGDDIIALIAEGSEGQMTILPKHASLMTMLVPSELVIRRASGDEIYMAITGGFIEVKPDRTIILADACERSDEIDIDRAAEAKRRAEERIKDMTSEIDRSRAEAALRRSMARLRVADKRRKTPGRRSPVNPPVQN